MLDPEDYRKAVHRSNLRPEYARIRRHSFGIGFAVFWLAYLTAMGVGLYYLTAYVAHNI